MKISLGSKIFKGPWGGGNNFVKNLSNYLKKKQCSVHFDLNQKDLDLILLTDPRKESQSACYNHIDIYNYINKVNSNVLVVHRINECDERKNTKNVNKQIINANQFSDFSIFISGWLKNLYTRYKNFPNSKIIYNGANLDFFFNKSRNIEKNEKFKLVTHHWSNSKNKGFHIYKMIDEKLDNEEFNKKIMFTIIGNIPKDMQFKNIKHIKPLFDKDLGDALRNNHAYITASTNEPGGNHQNEGINCGLPALYINSGCMKEYCEGFGIEYNKDNIFNKIFEMIEDYDALNKKTFNYSLNQSSMCSQYFDVFTKLLNNKHNIIHNRNWPKIKKFELFKNKIRKIIN